MSPLTPEQQARRAIDEALTVAGWQVQDEEEMNLAAGLGVAVREFPMAPGHGKADCLLFLEGRQRLRVPDPAPARRSSTAPTEWPAGAT